MSIRVRMFIFTRLILALKFRAVSADKNSVPMSSHFETWHVVCTGKIHASVSVRFSF